MRGKLIGSLRRPYDQQEQENVNMKIEQTINSLPPAARMEVIDFVDFLKQKYLGKKSSAVKEDASYWAALGEASLHKIWDNKEDDIYNELLKR